MAEAGGVSSMKHRFQNLTPFVGCVIGDTLRWIWLLAISALRFAHHLTPVLLAYLIYQTHC